jgi:hypothetical protein
VISFPFLTDPLPPRVASCIVGAVLVLAVDEVSVAGFAGDGFGFFAIPAPYPQAPIKFPEYRNLSGNFIGPCSV